MDNKDLKILELLKENSNLSTKEIAKKTLIPITTIHNRVKKLEKLGIIKNYTINLDDRKLGTISAYILLVVDYKLLKEKKLTQHKLAQKLKNHSIVEQAAMLTGSHDIIIKIRVNNIAEMDDFVTKYLRNLDGIEKSETMVVLNEI